MIIVPAVCTRYPTDKEPVLTDTANALDAADQSSNPTVTRILSSARICFEKLGVKRTTLEDIAREAQVSRQTVYNYLGSKQNIIDQVTLAEIRTVQTEMLQRMKRYESFADKLTEALVVSVQIARENVQVRRIIEELSLSSRVSSVDSPMFKLQRNRWEHMLKAALERDELAKDLELDDVVLWLGLSQVMLLIKIDHQNLAAKRMRHFVRRYIVEPLLGQHAAATPPPSPGDQVAVSPEADELRQVVIDQAMEISRLRRQIGEMGATVVPELPEPKMG